jgi:diadenosine tetraphosphatase ApaH/serine/threonine PP2A family protein phosphatase
MAAMDACIARAYEAGFDEVICCGDIVGYGAAPKECIEFMRERKVQCVKGNHDYYVTEDDKNFKIRKEAKIAIDWTRDQLDDSEIQWLRDLDMVAEINDDVTLVHSSLAEPEDWVYVLNPAAAEDHFRCQKKPICFNGHVHVPILAKNDPPEPPQLVFLTSTELEVKYKYLVNVGSVGQPRDSDPRACGVIYDTETRKVRLFRIPYNVDKARDRIIDAGLPKKLGDRLLSGY